MLARNVTACDARDVTARVVVSIFPSPPPRARARSLARSLAAAAATHVREIAR